MFYKMALRNVRHSIRNYTIYFLTLTFGVCLFYVFNSIDSQTSMLIISSSQLEILQTLSGMISYVSIFISVILGFLVVYANRFLIRRRKKELGLYMILGMDKIKISRILMIETAFIGVLSLALGLVLGIFLSQGLSVITAKLFRASLQSFHFVFSPTAFLKSILYFGLIFVIVMVFNAFSISKYKLIDLINANKKNEQLKVTRLWLSVVLFVLSLICIGVAYALIIHNGMLAINFEFGLCIFLGSLGTLLFFLSLSGFLLRAVQFNRKLYLKNLNMFVLRQLNSKINTTFISITLICIMLLMTIGTLSTGIGISSVLTTDLDQITPYDASLTVWNADGPNNVNFADLKEKLQRQGADLSFIKESCEVRLLETTITYRDLYADSIADLFGTSTPLDTEYMLSKPVPAISLSDYNTALTMQGKDPITLGENQFAINCDYPDVKPLLTAFLESGKILTINGTAYSAGIPVFLGNTFNTTYQSGDVGTLILADVALGGYPVKNTYINFNYSVPGEAGDAGFNAMLDTLNASSKTAPDINLFFNENTRIEVIENNTGISTVVSYLAIYIGFIFLITCAAVLALQQLSEASDNASRYRLLKKLGAEEKMIHRALFTQIFIYFMTPLSLAIVHSIVGIKVANKVISMFGHLDIRFSAVLTGVFILTVYGGYFIATYLGSKSILRTKE